MNSETNTLKSPSQRTLSSLWATLMTDLCLFTLLLLLLFLLPLPVVCRRLLRPRMQQRRHQSRRAAGGIRCEQQGEAVLDCQEQVGLCQLASGGSSSAEMKGGGGRRGAGVGGRLVQHGVDWCCLGSPATIFSSPLLSFLTQLGRNLGQKRLHPDGSQPEQPVRHRQPRQLPPGVKRRAWRRRDGALQWDCKQID